MAPQDSAGGSRPAASPRPRSADVDDLATSRSDKPAKHLAVDVGGDSPHAAVEESAQEDSARAARSAEAGERVVGIEHVILRLGPGHRLVGVHLDQSERLARAVGDVAEPLGRRRDRRRPCLAR